MKTMTASMIGVGLFMSAIFLGPTPAMSQSGKSQPEVLLEEGTKKILRAFELFMMTIPQYETPEVMPNGDIIIRRKNPPSGDGPAPAPKSAPSGDDKTKT